MDPPNKFEFYLNLSGIKPKLKAAAICFGINFLMVLTLIITAYLTLSDKEIIKIMTNLVSGNRIYFYYISPKNFLSILDSMIMRAPILEESIYRYLPLLMIKRGIRIKIRYDFTGAFIVLLCLVMNFIWARGHIPMPVPIFLAGIPLYWLVLKTKSLWPAILCHASLNLGLYFLAQTMIYLEFDTVMKAIEAVNTLTKLPAAP